jgi:hypothetical protein
MEHPGNVSADQSPTPSRQISAIYHEPALWVAGAPWQSIAQATHADLAHMRDVVLKGNIGTFAEVMVTREGLFAFDFTNWHPATRPASDHPTFDQLADVQRNRTLFINAFLALLYTNVAKQDNLALDRMLVAPHSLVTMDRLDPASNMGFGGIGASSLVTLSYTLMPAELPLFNSPNPQLLVYLTSRSTVSTEAVEASIFALQAFVDARGLWGLVMLDLFHRASFAFQAHDYEAALIDYWAVSERLISGLWKTYQEQLAARQPVSATRRSRLNDGRTFTVAVITEILALEGVIATDLYEELSQVRKARNDWIHGTVDRVQRSAALMATAACERLFEQSLGLAILGQHSGKVHG